MVSKTSHYSDISVFKVQTTTCRKTRTLHKTVHLHANSKQMVYRKNIVNNIFLVTYSPSWLKWRVTFLEEYAVINIHPKTQIKIQIKSFGEKGSNIHNLILILQKAMII